MAKILLAGGSGFIGSRLIAYLRKKGHETALLSRKKGKKDSFLWDPEHGTIDPSALEGVDVIVNLAGASLADGRWNQSNKHRIVESRVKSAEVLINALPVSKQIRAYVSASAIGYYGNSGEAWVAEDAPAGQDFLAHTCIEWENAASKAANKGIRTVMIRTGLVLDKEEGLLPVIARPVKWGLAACLGDGRQYMSWIHIDDLCAIYMKAIEDSSMQGPYNAVAPAPVRHEEFMKTLSRSLQRPMWLPHIPAALLKLALGEKATLVLCGQRVSQEKVAAAGYDFKFRTLTHALEDLAQRRKDAKEER